MGEVEMTAGEKDVTLAGSDVMLGRLELRRVQRAICRLQAVWGRGRHKDAQYTYKKQLSMSGLS